MTRKLEYNSLDELKDIVQDLFYDIYGDDSYNLLGNGDTESLGLRRQPLTVVSTEDYCRFLYFTASQGYHWLYNRRIQEFEYNKATYKSFINFIFHLEIIIGNLMKDISKLEGDIPRAILRNESNPEFSPRFKFRYEDKLITSLNTIISEYKIASSVFVSLVREGYTPQEALDLARSLSKVHDTKMALKEKGYRRMSEFMEEHRLTTDGLASLTKTYGLTNSEIILTVEDLYFTIYGEEVLTLKDLSDLTGLHGNALYGILTESLKVQNKTQRNRYIEEEVDILRDMYTFRGQQCTSLTDLCRVSGVSRSTINRILATYKDIEDFKSKVDKAAPETPDTEFNCTYEEALEFIKEETESRDVNHRAASLYVKAVVPNIEEYLDNIEHYTYNYKGDSYIFPEELFTLLGLGVKLVARIFMNAREYPYGAEREEFLENEIDYFVELLNFEGEMYTNFQELLRGYDLPVHTASKMVGRRESPYEIHKHIKSKLLPCHECKGYTT